MSIKIKKFRFVEFNGQRCFQFNGKAVIFSLVFCSIQCLWYTCNQCVLQGLLFHIILTAGKTKETRQITIQSYLGFRIDQPFDSFESNARIWIERLIKRSIVTCEFVSKPKEIECRLADIRISTLLSVLFGRVFKGLCQDGYGWNSKTKSSAHWQVSSGVLNSLVR